MGFGAVSIPADWNSCPISRNAVRRSDADLPETVALAIRTGCALETARNGPPIGIDWAVQYGTDTVVVAVSVLDEEAIPTLQRELESVTAPREIAVRVPDDETTADEPMQVTSDSAASRVRDGRPDTRRGRGRGRLAGGHRGEHVEERLVFQDEPDLLIKTGAERLSDFMIWQSVYSELYFTDVNWRDFRIRDYLRALRDYQYRQRRFGR